jgi:predicted  nucleic acid-binding Zn-ribbon protein
MLYLDRNFTKVQLDDHEKTLVQILEIVEQVNSRTEANTEDIEDTDTRFTDNFRVMEKAIKHTNEFLSVLDSRLTIEELYAKVSEQQLWEQLVKLTDQQSEAHPPELPQS